MYCDLFHHMEELCWTSPSVSQNLLAPTNDLHLLCLHYIFIPLINRHLYEWKQAWIMYPMRSEGHQTPYQLWTCDMHGYVGSTCTVASEMFEQLEQVSNMVLN